MEYVLTPHSKQIEPFAWWEGAFTESELNLLQQKAQSATQEAAVGGNNVDTNIRRSEVTWLECNPDTTWVFKKLDTVVSSLNARFFGFDLTGFGEMLQLTNYHENKQGMYGWHQDFGKEGTSRKLSVVVQLSDPKDYEGGNLEILTGGKPQAIKKQRGLVTVFPAWTLHQVTPVVKGTRQSLVAWVSGPSFR
jgi:PKHD-type hydroxylase